MTARWALEPNPRPSAEHFAYYNQFLGEDFCHADGENWPCLAYRQANPRCRCSHARVTHSKRTGNCWQTPCGCGEFRPEPIPARLDERYDPSPDPIDRSIS